MDSKRYIISFFKIMVVGILLVNAFAINAQQKLNEEFSIGVLEFEANGVTEKQAKSISKQFEVAVFNSNRFQIVTRQFLEAVRAKREEDKHIKDLDKMAIEQGKAVGADFIIRGVVTAYERKQTSGRKNTVTEFTPEYENTHVEFNFDVVDVETGIIATSGLYEGAINGVDIHIRNFIRREFPYTFRVLEIMNHDGVKKSFSVLVDGGFNQGLIYNTKVNVYEIIAEDVGGKIINREVELGKMRVEAVDYSGDFSKCYIRKGRNTIIKKIKEGKNIVCRVPRSTKILWEEYDYNY